MATIEKAAATTAKAAAKAAATTAKAADKAAAKAAATTAKAADKAAAKAADAKAGAKDAKTIAAEKQHAKDVSKAVASLIAYHASIVKVHGQIQETAKELLTLNGYSMDAGYNFKKNQAALTMSKADLKKGLLAECPFAVGDGSASDKAYKSLCSALQNMSAAGRVNPELSAGDTTGTKKAAKQASEPEKIIVREKGGMIDATDADAEFKQYQQITLTDDEKADIVIVKDMSGTIEELVICFEEEIFNVIASREGFLNRFLTMLEKRQPA